MTSRYSSDKPNRPPAPDLLGRDAFAARLAEDIKAWHGNNSLVIALYGSWGMRENFPKRACFVPPPREVGLTAAMAELDRAFLVVVDDIDRLNQGEIREIFQLVKINADFPQLIYLLLFDSERTTNWIRTVLARMASEAGW
jgi:predicted KAP-like P-loop ATPase